MDTILVAVGVPTKEGAGATPDHSHSVMLSERKLDKSETLPEIRKNLRHEENLIGASNTSKETNMKNELTGTEDEQIAEKAQENGWDIPDISDLLDSLSVSESEQKDSSFFIGTELSDASDHQSTLEKEGQNDTDIECMSWEWDTKHWTTENTITHHSK